MSDISGHNAARRAENNVRQTVGKLYDARNQPISSAADLRRFVEETAREINAGIVKDGTLIRTHDSTKYPYTSIAELPAAMDEFYAEFFRRLQDPTQDPVSLAAWVDYRIDLTDHFFADGCGKVSKAISGWVLMRASHELPVFPSDRAEIFSHAPTVPRGQDPMNDVSQLADWEDFYRGMFRDGAATKANAPLTPAEMYQRLPEEDREAVETARQSSETEKDHAP